MSVRCFFKRTARETTIIRGKNTLHTVALLPSDGDFAAVFGTVRVFHYNVEEWLAYRRSSNDGATGMTQRGKRKTFTSLLE